MSEKARSWTIRFAVAATLGVLLLLGWRNRARFAPADAGTTTPTYAATSLDGDTVSLADYRGQVVLLNVWATWCRPCVQEMPALERLHDALGAEGLTVLAVSVDAPAPGLEDPNEAVRAFASQLGLTFPILVDASGRIEGTFRVSGLPSTFVIDREGTLRQRILGPRPWDQPETISEIRALLEE